MDWQRLSWALSAAIVGFAGWATVRLIDTDDKLRAADSALAKRVAVLEYMHRGEAAERREWVELYGSGRRRHY